MCARNLYITLIKEAKCLLFSHYWPFLKWVGYSEAAGAIVKIGSSLKSNHQIRLNLFKSLIQLITWLIIGDGLKSRHVLNDLQLWRQQINQTFFRDQLDPAEQVVVELPTARVGSLLSINLNRFRGRSFRIRFSTISRQIRNPISER